MPLAYRLEDTRPPQIGLIVLQADETIEPDMRRLLPAGIEMLVSRVPSDKYVTSETLAAMAPVLTAAARLMPAGAQLSAVGYGCTSGTAEIGVERIHDLVREGVRTPAVTEPVSALLAACSHLGVKRLGVISPYIESVSQTLFAVLARSGVEIPAFGTFDQSQEATVVRITPGSIVEAATTVASQAKCDAIFLSCTNLRALDAIDAAERLTGIPVLSSNQVLAWHLCRLAGVTARPDVPGRLWRHPGATVQMASPGEA